MNLVCVVNLNGILNEIYLYRHTHARTHNVLGGVMVAHSFWSLSLWKVPTVLGAWFDLWSFTQSYILTWATPIPTVTPMHIFLPTTSYIVYQRVVCLGACACLQVCVHTRVQGPEAVSRHSLLHSCLFYFLRQGLSVEPRASWLAGLLSQPVAWLSYLCLSPYTLLGSQAATISCWLFKLGF